MHIIKTLSLISLLLISSQSVADTTSKFIFAGGLTNGGDTIASGTLENSSGDRKDVSIKAGGEIHLWAGLFVPSADRVDTLFAFGYHFDDINAQDGKASFKRYTLDAIPYFQISEKFRLGLGITYHLSPEYSESGAVGNNNFQFDDSLGFILSGTFDIGERGFLEVRHTVIDYDIKTVNGSSYFFGPPSLEGNNWGLYIGARF